MKEEIIDFNEYKKLCYILYEKIKQEKYEGIVCPLRGGFFLSYFMNTKLKIPIKYIEISSYKDKQQKEINVSNIIPTLTTGRYLVCDDIYDSGNTLNKIVAMYPYALLDLMCLVTKERVPNLFYGKLVDKDIWINFWWELL